MFLSPWRGEYVGTVYIYIYVPGRKMSEQTLI